MLLKAPSPTMSFSILTSLNLCPATFPSSFSGCRLCWRGDDMRTTPLDRQRKQRSSGIRRRKDQYVTWIWETREKKRQQSLWQLLGHQGSIQPHFFSIPPSAESGEIGIWEWSLYALEDVGCVQGRCLRVKNQQVYLKVPMAWM